MIDSSRRRITLRIDPTLFDSVDTELRSLGRDEMESEVAGFLFCRTATTHEGMILLAREWTPMPLAARLADSRFGLAWRPDFNAAVLDRAEETRTTPILVHRHGGPGVVRFSRPDLEAGRPLMSAMSRSMPTIPVGMIVYNAQAAVGEFWQAGEGIEDLFEVVVTGMPIQRLRARPLKTRRVRDRLVRQSQAIGPSSDAALAAASVALVGLSGGGSHCTQQLAHQGFGRFFLIDDQDVEAGNRGRLVGSRFRDDGHRKTAIAERTIKEIEPDAKVIRVDHRSSQPEAIGAIASADLVVACVDTFAAKAEINALCRRYMVPMLDVGMTVTSEGERLTTAVGQVVLTLPGGPCMRCLPLVSDAVLAAEAARRRPGYDETENAPGDPQVISMNGLLASQAANVALALVTGYLPRASSADGGYWQYDALLGELVPCEMPPRRSGCPGCAEDAEGDADWPD